MDRTGMSKVEQLEEQVHGRGRCAPPRLPSLCHTEQGVSRSRYHCPYYIEGACCCSRSVRSVLDFHLRKKFCKWRSSANVTLSCACVLCMRPIRDMDNLDDLHFGVHESMMYALNTPPVQGAQWTGIVTQASCHCRGFLQVNLAQGFSGFPGSQVYDMMW